MATSRNVTAPVHGNTIANDDVLVSQNLAKMMMAAADAANAATPPEPLIDLIARYNKVEEIYNSFDASDEVGLKAAHSATIAVLDEIAATTLVANTEAEAIAALRQAQAEDDTGPLASQFLDAAVAYFDKRPSASATEQRAVSQVKPTTIPALFARWKEQNDLASDMNLPDDVAQPYSDAAAEIEKLIVEAQAVTAQDFAMKLLATTYYGDFHPDDTLIAEAKALAGDVSDCAMPKSPGYIPPVTKGFLDPLVDTGRGSWVFFSKTTLEELLERYDRAHPEFTDCSREDVIQSWHGAEQWIIRNNEVWGYAQEASA